MFSFPFFPINFAQPNGDTMDILLWINLKSRLQHLERKIGGIFIFISLVCVFDRRAFAR